MSSIFKLLLSGLNLEDRSQEQQMAKPVQFIFFCSSQLIRIEFGMVTKQVKIMLPRLFSESCIQGKWTMPK